MKILRIGSVLLAGLFLTTIAPAKASAFSGTCQLQGEVSGTGISIGIGAQVLSGPGMITCLDGAGLVTQTLAVDISFVSAGIGLEYRRVRSLGIRSAPVSLRHGVADLLGQYSVGATTGVTLIHGGIDFDAALMCTGNGISLELALVGTDAIGLGARLHASYMSISARGEIIEEKMDDKVVVEPLPPIQDPLPPVQDPLPPIQDPDVQQ